MNFRIWLSSFALPLSQTLSLSSTKMPCCGREPFVAGARAAPRLQEPAVGVELEHGAAPGCSIPPAAG